MRVYLDADVTKRDEMSGAEWTHLRQVALTAEGRKMSLLDGDIEYRFDAETLLRAVRSAWEIVRPLESS